MDQFELSAHLEEIERDGGAMKIICYRAKRERLSLQLLISSVERQIQALQQQSL